MSDLPTASPSANANEAKPSAKAPAKPRASKGYTVPDIARSYLKARGIKNPNDARVDKACKVVRGIIRSHKSTLAKQDAAIKRHTKGADYGVLNKSTHDAIVKNVWKGE